MQIDRMQLFGSSRSTAKASLRRLTRAK